MGIMETYKENPCGTLSIPYWKDKHIRIPENMCIVHDSCYIEEKYKDYHDEPYFRLYHNLSDVQPVELDDISIVTAKYEDIPLLVDVINQSYTDLSVTFGQLIVNELLKRMMGIADFATVSGKVNNPTSPEILYRKCGFVGDDIWHILTK